MIGQGGELKESGRNPKHLKPRNGSLRNKWGGIKEKQRSGSNRVSDSTRFLGLCGRLSQVASLSQPRYRQIGQEA